MISRVADHCFWMGRYLERAESTSRVLSSTRTLALDAVLPPRQCWRPALIVSGEEPAFLERFGEAAMEDGEVVERTMTWDEENWSSIVRSVGAARENARSVRDLISLEVWESTNEVHLWLQSAAARAEYEEHRYGFYSRVRSATQLVAGQIQSTMLHDTALDLMWLGAMLERAGWTARVLDVHHHALAAAQSPQTGDGAVESALWMAILRTCSGFEPFLRRSRGQLSGRAAASFLLLERSFPRSVRYCVSRAHERLKSIRPPEPEDLPGGRALALLAGLDEWLSELGEGAVEPGMFHEVLTRIVDETAAVCGSLGEELLGAAPPSAQKRVAGASAGGA